MSNIPIISFVAFSNTGKTTFLEKLIPCLKAKGIRLAVLKHDAHEFQIDKEGKDSWRMTQAGADVTVITSATHAAIMENRPVDVNALLAKITDVDIIITEGYKDGTWPKIAMARAANGKPLPLDPADCAAVVTDLPGDYPCPVFALDEYEAVGCFIAENFVKNG
ncbi:MAG: molybdopterin-guanine dinucleotide biosynthesis protein B [Oscillospiraceae bacterium]|nr:molybdopterin-guanine dinucleotide biosynthesis protein B [Oscillospiraceae bacterium]